MVLSQRETRSSSKSQGETAPPVVISGDEGETTEDVERNNLVSIINASVSRALEKLNEDLSKNLKSYLDNKLALLQQEIKDLKKEIQELKNSHKNANDPQSYACAEDMPLPMRLQEKMVAKLTVDSDTLEQYTRRNSVRIFGVNHSEEEDTSEVACQVFNSLGIQCERKDIDVSHRVKAKETAQQNKPDAIIVKLVRREVKAEIMKKKKNLKNTTFKNVRIEEDLTAMRKRLIEVLKYGAVNRRVWSKDGVVFAKDVHPDGSEIRSTKVRNFTDLYNLELEPSKWYYVVGKVY